MLDAAVHWSEEDRDMNAIIGWLAEIGLARPTDSSYLAMAIAKRNVEWVAAILKRNPKAASARLSAGMRPLHMAASVGDADIAKLLVDHGADPKATTSDGTTPIDIAKQMQNLGVQFVFDKHKPKEKRSRKKRTDKQEG